jgi:hypothetical protein
MAETLASIVNSRIDPFNAVGQVARKPTVQARGAEARRQLEPVMRAESEAASEAMRTEAEAAKNLARQQAGVEEQAVRGMEQAGVKLQDVMGQYPQRRVEDFDPQAGIEMAAMTALLGTFAGSLGGRSALKAMKGITEGYRTGKQDLYERSVKQYESELQQYRDKISNAKSIFDSAIQLESARRGAGLAKLKELEPLLQDSVITAKIRAGDLKGASDMFEKAMQEEANLQSSLATATAKAKAEKSPFILEEGTDVSPVVNTGTASYRLAQNGVPISPTSPYQGLDEKAQRDTLKTQLQTKKEFDKQANAESQKAQKTLELMRRAEVYLGKIETGGKFGLPIVGGVTQEIYEAFGPDYANFAQIALQLQREAYVPGEGQVSNYERQLFARANIGLQRPNESNEAVIDATKAANRRLAERNEFFQRYFDVNKHLNNAQAYWEQYIEANPILLEVTDEDTGEKTFDYNDNVKSIYDFYRNPSVQTPDGQTFVWDFKGRTYKPMGGQ